MGILSRKTIMAKKDQNKSISVLCNKNTKVTQEDMSDNSAEKLKIYD